MNFYALFLDKNLTQSCMNGSKESLQCLKLEVIEDFTEIFPTGLPKTLLSERFLDHHIDLLPGTKSFSRAPYRLCKFETDEIEKVEHELLSQSYIRPSTSPWAASVLFHPRRLKSYGFALITEL